MLIRNVDSAGRVIIPKEVRDYLNIKINDKVKIELNGDKIILEKDKSYQFVLKEEIKVVNSFFERKLIDKKTYYELSLKLEKALEYDRRIRGGR